MTRFTYEKVLCELLLCPAGCCSNEHRMLLGWTPGCSSAAPIFAPMSQRSAARQTQSRASQSQCD